MSPIAAEGIFAGTRESQATPDEFAAEAVRLYANEAAWNESQQLIERNFRERFDQNFWWPRLAPLLVEAFERRASRRESNFIGRMLRHHQHRSTEFMSRWIEAKNASD